MAEALEAGPGPDPLVAEDVAPGRDKYEYMLQLRYILDSFECEQTLPGSLGG